MLHVLKKTNAPCVNNYSGKHEENHHIPSELLSLMATLVYLFKKKNVKI